MRLSTVFACLHLFLLSACVNPTPAPADKVPVPAASMFMEREHAFSSSTEKDKFLIGYYGSEVLDTLVHLIVLNPQGDTIYHDAWRGALLADSLPPSATDSLKHARVTLNMTRIIDRKIDFSGRQRHPAATAQAFAYRVGDSLVVIDWNTQEKHPFTW